MYAMSRLYEFAAVKDVEYTEYGVSIRAVADKKSAGMFAKYIKKYLNRLFSKVLTRN